MRGSLRAEEFTHPFVVQSLTRVRQGGGVVETYTDTEETIEGVLTAASARQMILAERFQTSYSHEIVVEGPPAKLLDPETTRLKHTDAGGVERVYDLIDYSDPGHIGMYTIYQAQVVEASP